MTTVLLSVLATVLAAIVIGALIWFFTPLRNRLETRRMALTGDHGLRVLTYPTTESMSGLDPDQMLGLQPFWLTDSDYYIPRDAPPAGPATKSEWTPQWAQSVGGEPAGWRHILVRIQATQDRTILLLPPTVDVEQTPLSGGLIIGPEREPGGNGLMCRQFEVRLDPAGSTVTYHSDTQGETPQFKMSRGDTEAFLVIASATNGRFEWVLDIPCLVDGEQVILRCDDHGQPFVTVGYEGLGRKWWMFSEQRWVAARW
jgi:hypothetical protein